MIVKRLKKKEMTNLKLNVEKQINKYQTNSNLNRIFLVIYNYLISF